MVLTLDFKYCKRKRKKERTSKNDELTVTECEIKLQFVINVSVVL